MDAHSSLSSRGFLARDVGRQPANLLHSCTQGGVASRAGLSRSGEDSVHRELDSIIHRVNSLIQFTNRPVFETRLDLGADASLQLDRPCEAPLSQNACRSRGLEPDVSFSEKPASNGLGQSPHQQSLHKSAGKHSSDPQGAESTATLQSHAHGTDMFSLSTLQANIDYGFAEAFTTYGAIGCKVWVYKGMYVEGQTDETESKAAGGRARARGRR